MKYLDEDFSDVRIIRTGEIGTVVDRTVDEDFYYIVELENNDIEWFKPEELEIIRK